MRISMSSPIFCNVPLGDFVPKVASAFDQWEVVADGLHYIPAHLDEFRQAVRSTDLDVTVHAPLSDINIASLIDDTRAFSVGRILEVVKSMRAADLDSIVIHPGHASPIGVGDWDAVRARNKDSLKMIAAACREHGVKAHLENMPNFDWPTCKTPEEVLPLASEVGMGFCLDTGHSNTNGNTDAFLEHKSSITHLHFHDNGGKKDEHLPVGEGTLDAKAVAHQLGAYTGYTVLENRGIGQSEKSRDAVARLGWKQ
ncbi:MAG: sugar phosphate isomerase/epimerase [Euryarchaeota archaeon]|nr:sugar phosphate isomerase/epimerase [Euryarchaeota archaeon]